MIASETAAPENAGWIDGLVARERWVGSRPADGYVLSDGKTLAIVGPVRMLVERDGVAQRLWIPGEVELSGPLRYYPIEARTRRQVFQAMARIKVMGFQSWSAIHAIFMILAGLLAVQVLAWNSQAGVEVPIHIALFAVGGLVSGAYWAARRATDYAQRVVIDMMSQRLLRAYGARPCAIPR